jgi:hypothetical protein
MSVGLSVFSSVTSMLPALNAFSIVAPSVMIGSSIRSSLTWLALRHFVFFTSVIDASCFHEASLKAPSVTMFCGSVHLLPYFVTAALLTGLNEWCDSCWMNHGCGEVSVTVRPYLPSALIPTLFLSALQFVLPGSQPLYASAPWIP